MISLKHYHSLVHKCQPITIRENDLVMGSRIGGNAPEGITPPIINPFTRYFATIALDKTGEQELSLFLSIDYDENSQADLWRNLKTTHTQDSSLVQFLIHPRSRRSSSTYLVSELSGHKLEIRDVIDDIPGEPNGALVLFNKIGGRPYFYYDDPKYIASINNLFAEGFIYLLQLTCPSAKEAPKGRWPFSDYTFHLLAKETADGIVWRYGWG
ncbi:MAG TPA: hypothetical protein VMH87_12760 [Pseudomonadales bacterium]|nr:hypothetical protein [Pseudomonadales bacterium]